MTDRENEELRTEVAIEDECEAAPDELMLERLLAQPFPLGDLIRDGAARELERRDGEWNAFTASVFRTMEASEVEAGRMSLEDRAINTLKLEVDGELAEMAPRFEGAFEREIEARIWRAAQERPSLGAAFSGWWSRAKTWLFEQPRAVGFAAAAAATALAVAFSVPRLDDPTPRSAASAPGVSIERVSFEGTVTVMQEGGMAVLWLADQTSS